MALVDQKKKVFGYIASARVLTEQMPIMKLINSLPSLNNGKDPIVFLTDLIKSLIGYEALRDSVVDILTYSFDEIEVKVKTALKRELISLVSCGVNPSIPNFLKSTGAGINIEVKKLDFLEMFKVDANSKVGVLLYDDITSPLTQSSDFNTFLYGVIQNDGVKQSWKNILDITFNSLGNVNRPNNSLTIKVNSNYDNKTLNDLNNDFIDSLKLFNAEKVVNNIIDVIFGSISVSISKTKRQLDQEGKINNIVDKLINDDGCDDEVDDSYFTFDNQQIAIIEQDSARRQTGLVKVKTSVDTASSIDKDTLITFNEEMNNSTSFVDKKQTLTANIDKMSDESAKNVPDGADKISVKLDFIQKLISSLTKAIVSIVLSPKVIIIFLINFKIVYTLSGEYKDPVEFIKKNKRLIKEMVKTVTDIVTEKLLGIAMKEITKLANSVVAKKAVEKSKNKLAQLLSLTGVPQDAIRMIKGLS
jgi:hypothetical protein